MIIRNYNNNASERHNLNLPAIAGLRLRGANPTQAKRSVGHENQLYNSVSERRDFINMQITDNHI